MRADIRLRIVTLLAVVLCCPWPAAAVVLTGEVQAVDAQGVFTPPSNSSPVVLRYYAPEGARVEKGQVVLRIDAGQSATQVRDLSAQIQQAEAKVAKEIAELEVKRVDAELALVAAEAALEKARIDAKLPRELISGLDHDRYQGELKRASRETALKREELEEARAAVTRRREDGTLEIRQLAMRRDYHTGQVATAEVRADRDGVLVHGFDPRSGTRFDEGSTSWPGNKVGEIVSDGGLQRVRAWALEPDRVGLEVGQSVDLRFDALPEQAGEGRIAHISGVPEARQEWGEGRYFAIDIDFAEAAPVDALLPGMSVRVVPRDGGESSGGGR
ncbi:HlyD family efflux transporter periplasmic adaptor subunit [Lysobacter maris]|uniref:HlyD family efflux transporter periplasmic adaptor subunit n=1 Tax=Marilutibacter maris TaxID=1605891 RepID=A0A508ALQ0_9GAMM|nr:HlyD family efflux transporter periplasmic adaptor subunit [Lysobacter maris]KAB8181277.1 HlyD family efflux transporter periplasmic adaptor subunit [Lysobacter maris]